MPSPVLSFDPSVYTSMKGHLFRRSTEQVAFLFVDTTSPDKWQVIDIYAVPPTELVFESRFHAEVSEEAQAKVIKMAWDRQLSLGEVHSHPGSRHGTAFSPSDLSGFSEFVPHVAWRLRTPRYVALVFGEAEFDALAWDGNPHEAIALSHLAVGEEELRPTAITIRQLERERLDAERYSRQMALFGAAGQEMVRKVSVAVIGVGGLGSHIVQQLAYLGVTDYRLIDADVVDRSNLNRLIGANENDLGAYKVDVAARLITAVQPEAHIDTVHESVISDAGFNAIAGADIVIGCVDNDGVRLVLLEVACASQKPYIDLATDVPEVGRFGGRSIFTGVGAGCPFCREELDQHEIRRFFMNSAERLEDDRIYGVDRSALGHTGPSVVFLNGVVASLAVTEFTAFVTGLRPPVAQLNYRGEKGIVTTSASPAKSSCYYCDDIWNGRAKANLKRYLTASDAAGDSNRVNNNLETGENHG